MSTASRPERHEVVIVGSGCSGLGQALALRRAGIDDVVVLEKADTLGGTGRDDADPGSAHDTPSSHPDPHRSPRRRAPLGTARQPEVRGYLERVAREHDLHRHLRFGHEMVGATWDEATATWTVRTRAGERFVARFLVAGLGVPHRPLLPGVHRAHHAALAAGTDAVDHLDVLGRGGRSLRDVWRRHGTATHLGITVSDFPNLFLLPDPDPHLHTGPGRHSVLVVMECRTRYVTEAVSTVRNAGMTGLDVRAEVQQRSNAAVRRRLDRGTRRRGGRTGRYLVAAGVDRAIRFGSTVRYRVETRRFRPEDFELFGRLVADADGAAGPTVTA